MKPFAKRAGIDDADYLAFVAVLVAAGAAFLLFKGLARLV